MVDKHGSPVTDGTKVIIPGQETPSVQQEAVFDWIHTKKGSLNLVARAGTGKTTTLLMATKFMRGDSIILAYNKSIAEEIKAKLIKLKAPSNISAQTVHALGFSSWRRVAPQVQVDADKVSKIIKTLSKAPDDFYIRNIGQICKLVSLAKQCAFGFLIPITDQGAWFDLAEHHSVDDLADNDTVDELVNVSITVLEKSLSFDRETIDFDDMILAPLVHNSPVYYKDWILLDEAQDTNNARRALAMKCLKPGTGRLIAVGDDRQAIYGFTGADHNAMDLIKEELGSAELKLTVTYRCPKAVVAEANQFVPDLVAHESAPEGLVRSLDVYDPRTGQLWFLTQPPDKTSVILCRNTKPLIEHAYLFLANGIGCKVEGRDIGEGLVSLAKRWKSVTTTHQLKAKLEDYKLKEMQKYMAKGKEDLAQAIEDKVGALEAVISRVNGLGLYDIDSVVSSIRSLFGDSKAGEVPKVVTLSTVHKSKGREWNTVYILDRANLMPSKYARKEWQLKQEENLEYVAITRSKNELVDLVMPRKEAWG
jgi:superfamily I DNA/RNA helicase